MIPLSLTLRSIITFLAIYFIIARCVASADDIDDIARSGNYEIVYCKANETRSHAGYLQALIPYVQSILQDTILPDLERGIASPAYRAYFKTNNNLDPVRQIYTNMIEGSNVLYSAGNITSRAPPTIICADTVEPFVQPLRLMEYCNTPPRPVMNVMQPNKVLSICPIFWTLPRVARKAACPRVSNGEIVSPDAWNLATTQFAVLVHELAHIYNDYDNREEVYGVKEVIALNATRSLENAQNFAYYAACKYSRAAPNDIETVEERLIGVSHSSGMYRISCTTSHRRSLSLTAHVSVKTSLTSGARCLPV